MVRPSSRAVALNTPMETTTIHKMTYVKHETQQRLKPERKKYQKPVIKMNCDTTYALEFTRRNDDFKEHKDFERAKSIRPKATEYGDKLPFQSVTTHTTDYTHKSVSPRPSAKKDNTYKPSGEIFQDVSTFQNDFTAHKDFVREKSFKPEQRYMPSDEKFDGTTIHSMAYQAWPVQEKEKPRWAQRTTYTHPVGHYEHKTSYQDNFIDPKTVFDPKIPSSCRPEPFLHDGNLKPDDGIPFERSTQYKNEFVNWEGTRPAKSYKLQVKYQPPITKFIAESHVKLTTKEHVHQQQTCADLYSALSHHPVLQGQ
uniref:Protein FAM154B-like n=1 Tax=Saccoglossus kowalevskii TaxID=10224 RepID=A0ABM0M8T3_SACKO|nr:PREDICTED: protein FAM154B-like [Saccoglossus kowalevskii]